MPRRPRRPTPQIVRDARRGAEDRQRALDEVCRGVLRDFVGRDMTPTIVAEAEAAMRSALDDAIRQGKYVLPDGLLLNRVEIGADMRLKVYFAAAPTIIKMN